jgi:L-2,4-diaminobutyrate decarboxylase
MNNLEKYYNPEFLESQGHELVSFLAADLKRQISSEKLFSNSKPNDLLNLIKKEKLQDPDASVATIAEFLSKNIFQTYSPYNLSHQVSVPTPASVLFNFIEAYFNASTPSFERSLMGNVVDKFVTDWIISKIGFGPNADGIMTTGATLGNLTALLTARAVKGKNVWNDGITEQMAIMVSEQAHYCIDKAARTMGFGEKGIIKIKTNDKYQMDLNDLSLQYEKAKDAGVNVIAVVGSACTTSTGSFDDLEVIAEFAKTNDIWFHVDGAHGGPAVFSEKYRSLVKGLSLADSATIDLHKMLMSPNVATVVLYKNSQDSYKTFSQDAKYLFPDDSDESYDFGKRTYECTKPTSGIRLYGVLKLYGESFFSEVVDHCFGLGNEFAVLVKNDSSFELLVEPECNIVCFRIVKENADLNELNKLIKKRVNEDGKFFISSTVLKGEFWLRIVIMNPLTTIENLNELLDFIKKFHQ